MKGTRTYQLFALMLIIAVLNVDGGIDINSISASVDDLKGLIESCAAIYGAILTALKIAQPAPMLHEKKKNV